MLLSVCNDYKEMELDVCWRW